MNEHNIENLFRLTVAIVLIGYIWQAAEMIFYGEIQPRRVDALITVVWTVVVALAYSCGYRHGKKAPMSELKPCPLYPGCNVHRKGSNKAKYGKWCGRGVYLPGRRVRQQAGGRGDGDDGIIREPPGVNPRAALLVTLDIKGLRTEYNGYERRGCPCMTGWQNRA